jgi:uncharacterized repeat protein (TIGR01451 family)
MKPRNTIRRIVYVLSLIVLLAGTFAQPAHAVAVPPHQPAKSVEPKLKTIVRAEVPTPPGAGGGYWSAERMKNARPYPLPEPSAQPDLPPEQQATTGTPGWAPSRAPDGLDLPVVSSAPVPNSGLAVPGNTDFAGAGYATQFPYSAVGKIFFTMGGDDYSCSGAAIGENAVWTAGHCLSNGANVFHTNWAFFPAYRDGASPYPGPWEAVYMVVPTNFHYSMDLGVDYGIAIVKPVAGRTLRQTVGALGFAWNLPTQRSPLLAAGYPSPYYGGKKLVQTYAAVTMSESGYLPHPLGIVSKLKSGASGGPWITDVAVGMAGQANFLSGNISYQKIGFPYIFSPNLQDAARQLWGCAQDSTPEALHCVDSDLPVQVSSTVSASQVLPGDLITYTVTVSNRSAQNLLSIDIQDLQPAGVTTLAGADLSGVGCIADATVNPANNTYATTCSLAVLPAGESATATYQFTAPTTAATIVNHVKTGTLTTFVSNATDTTTRVNQADLALELADIGAGHGVQPGTPFTYSLRLSNAGPLAAQNLVLTDPLPAEVTFVSADLPGGSCVETSGLVNCTLATLDVNATATATLTVTAPAQGVILTHTAALSAATIDGYPTNNQSSLKTAVHAADLSLTQSASREIVEPKAPLTYSLEIRNDGPSVVSHLVLTDTLPDGAGFAGADLPGGSCAETGGTVTCTLDALANAASVTATLQITAPDATDSFTNTASLSADQADAYPENNQGIAVVTGVDPDCQVRIADDPSIPYYSVQEAIDAAQVGATVKVAGTCTYAFAKPAPTRMNVPFGTVYQVAYIRKILKLQGGYTPDNWQTPDPQAHPTFLDGGNSFRPLLVAGPDEGGVIKVTIEGLNLVNGLTSPDDPGDWGGAGYIAATELTFLNNRVTGSTAGYLGGGLYLESSPNATLTGNLFQNNRVAPNQVGGYYAGSYSGGGLALVNSPHATLADNRFDQNQASFTTAPLTGSYGGGLALLNSGSASLLNTTFTANTASLNGDAILIQDSGANNTLFNALIANQGAGGKNASVYVNSSSVDMWQITFAQNETGQALATVGSGTATLTNSIVAGFAEGVHAANDSQGVLVDHVLWFNTPLQVSGPVKVGSEYSGDPLFIDPAVGDYHLGAGSPALNRGIKIGPATDLDHFPRDVWPDLGAYESRLWKAKVHFLPVVLSSR